jgi:hypothetical protein
MRDVVEVERLLIGTIVGMLGGALLGAGWLKIGGGLLLIGILFCSWDLPKEIARKRRLKVERNVRKQRLLELTSPFIKTPGLPERKMKGLSLKVPASPGYWDFMEISNGMGIGSISLWSLEKVVSENPDWKTRAVVTPSRAYGLCFFGNDGTSTRYAFRIEDWNRVVVKVSQDGSLEKVSTTFIEFLEKIVKR